MTIKKEFRVSTSLLRDLERWINEMITAMDGIIKESRNLQKLIITDIVDNPSRDKAISAGRHYEDVIEALTECAYNLKAVTDQIIGCSILEDETAKTCADLNRDLDAVIRNTLDLSDSIPSYLKGITRLPAGSPELENEKNRMMTDFSNIGENNDLVSKNTATIKKALTGITELAATLKSDRII